MNVCIVFRHSIGTFFEGCNSIDNICCMFRVFKMFKIIKSPNSLVIYLFLGKKYVFVANIHQEIYEGYGKTAMCAGNLHQWVRDFNTSRDSLVSELLEHFLRRRSCAKQFYSFLLPQT